MFDKLTAGSWKTTLVGILEAVAIWALEEVRNGGGLPNDSAGWILWVSGALRAAAGFVQKDFNKSNAALATTEVKTLPIIPPAEPVVVTKADA